MRKAAVVALALVIVPLGCGGPDGSESRAEATEKITALVDATAEAVADDLEVTPRPGALLPTGCMSGSGKGLGTVEVPYTVKLGITADTDIRALFDRIQDYWESEGYDVEDPEFLDGNRPRMRADADGYALVLRVLREFTTANIDGITPCVKDPAGKPN